MMGRVPSGVRAGLLELFYGVYQNDADRCLDALIAMGVLVPATGGGGGGAGGDLLAVRRTARFLLDQFNERLARQRAERKARKAAEAAAAAAAAASAAAAAAAAAAAGDPQQQEQALHRQLRARADAEVKALQQKALASIGEDLLLAAADRPFRFPAAFTFVVRAFSVLDGVGKTLDPRFDITEISAPYARELLLEARPRLSKWGDALKKASANQGRAVANLFKGPNRLEDVAATLRRLEAGDLKLRVRALEAERALARVAAGQRAAAAALVASTLVNVGTVLAVAGARAGAGAGAAAGAAAAGAAAAATTAAGGVAVGAAASFAGAALFGLAALAAYLQVVSLERKERQLAGGAA